MNSILFTQYLRPDGHRSQRFFDCDKELAEKAQAIIDKGYHFECEVLMNQMVSLTISDGEEDVAIELARNGPEVPEAVKRLVETFFDGENFFDTLGTTP